MWRKADSKRFVPTDIGQRFRSASFHDPAHDRAQRQALRHAVHVNCYGQSQIGGTRRINQDQFFMVPLESDSAEVNCLLGVADGIGGAPGGEDASFLAVETLTRFIREESARLLQPERNDGEITQTLTRGLQRCHAELQNLVNHHPEFSGMGTTMTAGLVLWPHLYLVHMGDARAYLLREGGLRRLTRDHTYGQALLEAGVLTESTIKTSAMRNVLSNFLSGDLPEKDPLVHPDVHVDLLKPGDTLLFCTDGLTHGIPDEELARMLSSDRDSKELCGDLIQQAQDLRARDDATVLIARFDGAPAPSAGHRKAGEKRT
jgi:protein phosphatase